ncbi:MAG: hypothetical protein MI757_04140, partial [Pirellulales bacterium]|nr:hypothetical protein [Pirellulales bacterium]
MSKTSATLTYGLIASLTLIGIATPSPAALTTVGDYDFSNNAAPSGFTEFGDPTYSSGMVHLDGTGDYLQAVAPTTVTDNMVLEAIVSADTFGAFNFVGSISQANGANSGYGI